MSHLRDLTSALIDGELAGAELDRANAHLAACAACQAEVAQMRLLKRELSALGEVTGAEALIRRLLAMPGPVDAPRSRSLPRTPGRCTRRRRGRYVVLGAVSLVVAGLAVAAFGMGGASGPAGRQITPQLEMFDMQHAATSGDVPFADSPTVPGRPEASATAVAKP